MLRYAAIVVVLWCSECCGEPPPKFMDNTTLAGMLLTVDPWTSASTNYSETNWEHLVVIARLIQKSDSESVCRTLRKYQQDQVTHSMDEILNDSKLYLLIRVVFDLPEHDPNERKWSYFGGWLAARTDYNSDGTRNRAWPITWDKGNPRLISGCLGIQGFERYSAVDEFLYFRSKCLFRDLSSLHSKLR